MNKVIIECPYCRTNFEVERLFVLDGQFVVICPFCGYIITFEVLVKGGE